jgi:hypothetical protein
MCVKQTIGILISGLLLFLHACAFDIVHVKQIPTKFETTSSNFKAFELEKEVSVRLDTTYSRSLKKGTRWVCVGTTTEGAVYRTNDQILTIEGSNIHEAYIVVKSGMLIGFYLPVERTFSPLSSSIALSFKEIAYNP